MTSNSHIRIDFKICEFCGTCAAVCPENCMIIREDGVEIVHEACTRCQKCVWACPVKAPKLE